MEGALRRRPRDRRSHADLDGQPHTIVGVTPPDFYFPDRDSLLWTPYTVPPVVARDGHQSIRVFSALGRLRPGATADQAAAEGTAAARGVERPPIAEAIFGKGKPVEVRVQTLIADMTGTVRPALLVLSVGVGFVLLIGCANVANLLLSRGVTRQRGSAVRAAIGATGARLVRQLLTESLVLSTLGRRARPRARLGAAPGAPGPGAGGVSRVSRTSLWTARLWPSPCSRRWAPACSPACLRPGAPPRPSAARAARWSGRLGQRRRAAAGRRPAGGRGGLAVVLLVGAGLLVRSFTRLVDVDAGYETGNVLLAQVYLDETAPPGADAGAGGFPGRTARAVPRVEAAGAGNMAPLVRSTMISMFDLPDPGAQGERLTARAVTYVVTPGYAEALSLRLVEGRLFAASDLGTGTRTMVVNEQFARSYLADGKPIVGRRWEGRGAPGGGGRDVDSRSSAWSATCSRMASTPTPRARSTRCRRTATGCPGDFNLVLRTAGDPLAVVATLRAVVSVVEPRAAVEVATLASRLSASVSQPRFAAATLAAFALLALTLASTGLHGVLSYSVSQRRREMGVRERSAPLRATSSRLVLRQGLGVTAAGLAVGLLGAVALTRLLAGMLFGVTPLDGGVRHRPGAAAGGRPPRLPAAGPAGRRRPSDRGAAQRVIRQFSRVVFGGVAGDVQPLKRGLAGPLLGDLGAEAGLDVRAAEVDGASRLAVGDAGNHGDGEDDGASSFVAGAALVVHGGVLAG